MFLITLLHLLFILQQPIFCFSCHNTKKVVTATKQLHQPSSYTLSAMASIIVRSS